MIAEGVAHDWRIVTRRKSRGRTKKKRKLHEKDRVCQLFRSTIKSREDER